RQVLDAGGWGGVERPHRLLTTVLCKSAMPGATEPIARPRTTKLYDRTADTITLDEIEKIAI
ncbi:MAG: hypothetical protein V3T08_00050, partial [Gemmatimonadota bacterium]